MCSSTTSTCPRSTTPARTTCSACCASGDGETVTVTDGHGSVAGVPRRRWPDRAGRRGPSSSRAATDPLTVAFAIPKQDRPEWIVQKLTELGVDRIVLLHAERSVVRWTLRAGRPAPRQAASGRRRGAPAVAWRLVARDRRPDRRRPIVLARARRRRTRWPTGRARADRTIAIGPEGGWSPAELAIAAGQRVDRRAPCCGSRPRRSWPRRGMICTQT